MISASRVPAMGAANDLDGDGHTIDDCAELDPTVHPDAPDVPDLMFADTNCDGIDGRLSVGVFVAPDGNDFNVGSSTQPFQTIQKAVDVAKTSGHEVYAAVGTYPEGVSLPDASYSGVRIYGGYERGPWTRTTDAATQINGTPQALYAAGATDVVVQLANLSGQRGAGVDAYGVRAVNGAEVALVATDVTAGNGLDRGSGSNGSQPAQPAKADNGDAPANCDTAGAGGSSSAPIGRYNGGTGGTGGEETNDGENGQAGSSGEGPLGGAGGAGGIDEAGDPNPPNWAAMDGQPGEPGGAGAIGPHGASGANDLGAAGTTWVGRSGTSGGAGSAGSGGGGGGGGAGRGSTFSWAAGPGGGQGGYGGLGGTGGGGGLYGGGSFGVYLYNANVVATGGSTIASGNGGAGGAGGTGGLGGLGGEGGDGASPRGDCNKTAGNGGDGGDGGPGGNGGNGGGGAGGPSAAIFRGGTSLAIVHSPSTLSFGTSGTGGSGGAVGPSGDGQTGQSGQYLGAGGGGVSDFDADGVTDGSDSCPTTAKGSADSDADGCPDAPTTSITSGPAQESFVLSRSATVGFASNEASSTFTCQLDMGAGTPCASPQNLAGLSQTTHTFRVWARDASGDQDPDPATLMWTVPRNNTTLTHSAGWTKKKASGYYLGTYSQSKTKGSKLTKSASDITGIALVATKGPNFGKVKVFLGSTLLKEVGLGSATLQKKKLIVVGDWDTPRSGKVKVVVSTAGKVVRIEGLGIETAT